MELNDQLATEWWIERLERPLTEDRQRMLEAYLEVHPVLADELEKEEALWQQMAEISTPEPSSEMDLRFESMLGKAIQESRKPSLVDQLTTWFGLHWQVSLGSLAMGLVIGVFLIPRESSNVHELTAEVQDMKELLMLTMIEKPQAQDRIKAVNLTRELPKVDSRVTDALISTLNHDESINVRLAALEALISYGKLPEVREALISSISAQQSPLVQVALADAMVALQEKAAVDKFGEMLESSEVDESIKPKIQSTIETLRSI
ncbi:HEAT repeat domain-containing protein [Marinoscillum sp.]|uniref:HEAT repeat domain-containing protein n=1 Tax=Marinoscillum sp. TaxID=2024838 RepID=UPI003BAD94DF